jgi:hypothetical protein
VWPPKERQVARYTRRQSKTKYGQVDVEKKISTELSMPGPNAYATFAGFHPHELR